MFRILTAVSVFTLIYVMPVFAENLPIDPKIQQALDQNKAITNKFFSDINTLLIKFFAIIIPTIIIILVIRLYLDFKIGKKKKER